MKRSANLYFFVALFCGLPLAAQVPSDSEDYPQWRGPNRYGISNDKGLLKQWPEEGPAIGWQVDNVGVGYSSVAIKDGLIVTMGDLKGVEHIIALNVKDGSTVWAVQPDALREALNDRVEREFASIDTDDDGRVSEIEALSRFKTDFYQYDADAGTPNEDRGERLFDLMDKNDDGKLTFAEAGSLLGDEFSRADKADPSADAKESQERAALLFEEADSDKNGLVDRKEAKKSYLSSIFNKADQSKPGERRGDQQLSSDEISNYLAKREAGKDGELTDEEFIAFYDRFVAGGDGFLSRKELRGLYGGYRNGQGDGPRATPTIDGNRIYAEGGNGDVTCLDLKTGATRWHRNLIDDFGGRRPGWGYSESPLIIDNLVVVTPGGSEGTVVALDKFTGEIAWQSEELTEAAHYSSAVEAEIEGVRQIIQFAKESAFGVAVEDGKLLWQYSGANNSTANCCTPIVSDGHVFVASAYGTGGGLASITRSGSSLTADEVYFEKKMGIHHGGTVKVGDYLYSCGAGTLICIEFLTGDIQWQNRCVGKGSLTVADGMLYVLGEKQELALVEATPDEYREKGRIELPSHGRPSWAHPVVSGGRLYIRDQESLTAFELR